MLSIKFIVLCSNKWIDISVPCRGTTFLNGKKTNGNKNSHNVSVPCRGTTFLNEEKANNLEALQEEQVFVPCRGTTFLNSIDGILAKLATQFPSPVGELHFSMRHGESRMNNAKMVSVPCRGTTFLNKTNKNK